MEKQKIKLTVSALLKAIAETNNTSEIIKYENQIACMLASPIMFLGAIINFIAGYIHQADWMDYSLNGLVLLFMGVFFEVLMRVRISAKRNSYFISILYAEWFLFIVFRMYHVVGPVIWTLACLQCVIAASRVKRNMIVIIGVVAISTSIHIMISPDAHKFQFGYPYFITQTVLLGLLIIVLCIIHKMNSDRYIKLRGQFQELTRQKEDITALYEEITATEEELRSQNEQLITYTEELKKSDEHLYELAYFDLLTGIPNRKMFMEQLDVLIEQSKKNSTIFYVVFIDVDCFKKINDTLGHHIGDKFISFAVERLKKAIHEKDLLGRIGGDEFGLVISRELDSEEAYKEIENLRKVFLYPFKIENIETRLTASFGIATYPYDGKDAAELLKRADMSMYKAKELGKNNIQFFKRYMQDEMIQKMAMEDRLIYALKNDEFFLAYQPQYSVADESIRGFEALARWNSPELDIVPPMQFIPLAEESGLIIPLGRWILKTACMKYKKLQEQYGLNAFISVNISAVQMKDPDFIKDVKTILDETGINPKNLELEITESVFVESLNQAIQILNELKELGVRIALDDFGTGYSSLSYLKLLPIDTLKIDKSFIKDLPMDSSQVNIVGDIISLGHNLGVSIIAEGVEYTHQLQYLKKCSCDFLQGFLFNKPLGEKDVTLLLEALEEDSME